MVKRLSVEETKKLVSEVRFVYREYLLMEEEKGYTRAITHILTTGTTLPF